MTQSLTKDPGHRGYALPRREGLMNVLVVHNFYQQAGGEDQVFADEAKLLEANGHTVARFTMDNDAIDGMGKLALARKTIWNNDARQKLSDAARSIKADVVHFHNTFPLI